LKSDEEQTLIPVQEGKLGKHKLTACTHNSKTSMAAHMFLILHFRTNLVLKLL